MSDLPRFPAALAAGHATAAKTATASSGTGAGRMRAAIRSSQPNKRLAEQRCEGRDGKAP